MLSLLRDNKLNSTQIKQLLVKKITTTLLAIIIVFYPVIIYFGLTYFEPRYIAIILIALLGLRLAGGRATKQRLPWLKLTSILAIAVLLITVVFDIELGVLLYPVAMNLGLLTIFAYSLYKKPSVIETFARIQEPELDEFAVKYTEKVTMIWCLFFIINGTISLYTVFYLSVELWTLYNGLISYVLMGTLMTVEFLVRKRVKAKRNKNV